MSTEQIIVKQDYWSQVKRRFTSNKRAVVSMYVLLFLILVALMADFIANDKPIYCSYQGETYFPVFKEYGVKSGLSKWDKQFLNVSWYELDYDKSIWPIVPFKATTLDKGRPYQKPGTASSLGKGKHFLGTDGSNRDLLAGLIHGTRIAFMVGIISMGLAFVIGIFWGGLAGFWGDNSLQLKTGTLICLGIGLIIALFYGWFVQSYGIIQALQSSFFLFLGRVFLSIVITIVILVLFWYIGKAISKKGWLAKANTIPLDLLVTRLIELVVSVPTLILIMAVVAVTKPSLINVMAIIGLTGWTGIARFVRAELLKVRSLEYIEASKSLGFSKIRSFLKHALPNSLTPVFITLAFGMAGAILTESFLSFLGIGVPLDTITWGRLLKEAESSYRSWWLAIFPGMAIFITVTAFNLIGEGLTDALDPKKRG